MYNLIQFLHAKHKCFPYLTNNYVTGKILGVTDQLKYLSMVGEVHLKLLNRQKILFSNLNFLLMYFL